MIGYEAGSKEPSGIAMLVVKLSGGNLICHNLTKSLNIVNSRQASLYDSMIV